MQELHKRPLATLEGFQKAVYCQAEDGAVPLETLSIYELRNDGAQFPNAHETSLQRHIAAGLVHEILMKVTLPQPCWRTNISRAGAPPEEVLRELPAIDTIRSISQHENETIAAIAKELWPRESVSRWLRNAPFRSSLCGLAGNLLGHAKLLELYN